MQELAKNRTLMTLAVAAALIAIPLLVVLSLHHVESRWDAAFLEEGTKATGKSAAELRAAGISVASYCSNSRTEMDESCGPVRWVRYCLFAAYFCFVAGVVVTLAPFLIRNFVGRNRARLAAVFTPLVRFLTLAVGALITAQALIGTYAFYIFEVAETGRFHVKIVLIGIVGVLIGWGLLAAGLRAFKKERSILFGVRLTPEKQPRLFDEIAALAHRIGADSPTDVIGGVEPSFFVTAAPAQLLDGTQLDGRTLFLSLPFMRLLSLDEFRAVVGHELSHFKGEDTKYSLKFAPAYARLSHAIAAAGDDGIFQSIARMPLNLALQEFAETERTIGRDRELIADKGAAIVAAPDALIRALIKVSVHGGLWSAIVNQSENELAEGRVYQNLSSFYADIALHSTTDLDLSELRSTLGASRMAHPIDTHPTLTERASNLGVDLVAQIEPSLCEVPDSAANVLVEQPEEIEQAATLVQHRTAVLFGRVVMPKTTPTDD